MAPGPACATVVMLSWHAGEGAMAHDHSAHIHAADEKKWVALTSIAAAVVLTGG